MCYQYRIVVLLVLLFLTKLINVSANNIHNFKRVTCFSQNTNNAISYDSLFDIEEDNDDDNKEQNDEFGSKSVKYINPLFFDGTVLLNILIFNLDSFTTFSLKNNYIHILFCCYRI